MRERRQGNDHDPAPAHAQLGPARRPACRAGLAWRAAAHKLACSQVVTHPPGTFFRYSDINYVLLGQLVERCPACRSTIRAQAHIYAPLKMRNTGYLPLRRASTSPTIAPTQKGSTDGEGAHGDLAPGQLLQGVVHDPTARRMGGVAGSAGVFTTAHDVARYARMLLAGRRAGRRAHPQPGQRAPDDDGAVAAGPRKARGLGMDIDSPYAQRPRGTVFPVGSYGHTGFTGCILWVDPQSRRFYVFLSNRVYPDDKSNILDLYMRMGTLAAQAAGAD
jgi:CubicO group peptidase (beta-lactamase class C family)